MKYLIFIDREGMKKARVIEFKAEDDKRAKGKWRKILREQNVRTNALLGRADEIKKEIVLIEQAKLVHPSSFFFKPPDN